MASTDQDLRRNVGEEREKLVEAVTTLRSELREATDIKGKLRAKLPVVVAGTLGLGFIGATARLLTRRRRARPRLKQRASSRR
ncbi:MAG: hypothetical protein ACXWYO_01535 [Gaiellaceae bacterium]